MEFSRLYFVCKIPAASSWSCCVFAENGPKAKYNGSLKINAFHANHKTIPKPANVKNATVFPSVSIYFFSRDIPLFLLSRNIFKNTNPVVHANKNHPSYLTSVDNIIQNAALTKDKMLSLLYHFKNS